MTNPAVILGANFYISLGAIRTLGRHGVPVYALDYDFKTAYALSSKYVSQKVLCPNINEDEEGVARFLIDFGKQFSHPPVLMASTDNYALLISRYAEKLAPHYLFPDNSPGLLEEIINKNRLYVLAKKHGMRMPLTFFPAGEDEITEAAEAMVYPCIVKPALSHEFVKLFRQKCLTVHRKEELQASLGRAHDAGLEVMIQEIIPGFDDQMYVFDAYVNKEGLTTHTLTAQKLRQFPINFGSSTLTHHYWDPALQQLGLDYIRRLNYRGYGEIEFKKHARTGDLYMIEINARLSSLNALFDACGVEFTYIMYRDLIGDPLPDYHLTDERPLAFWHAYEDVLSSTKYILQKQLSFKQVLKPWFSHRKVHAIWARDDIRPVFSFGKILIKKVAAKIFRLFSFPRLLFRKKTVTRQTD